MKRVLVPWVWIAASACASDTAPTPVAESTPPDTALLSAETVKIASFSVAEVTREPWRDLLAVPARVSLDLAATEPIGSIVEGRVTHMYVMPGDRVSRGQVLVAIHSHEMMDARATFAKAKAGVTAAQASARLKASSAARAERLFELRALSTADLERARADREDGDAQLAAANAELARAEALVEHLVGHDALPSDYDEHWVLIRAPMSGQVVRRNAEPGNVVLVGAPLVTVSRTASLVLVMHLPDAAAVPAVGAPVTFTTAATGSQAFAARVSRVFPSADTLTRTVEVHATITDRQAGRLRAELFATAQIGGATGGTALVVPATAIQALEGDTVVIEAQQRGEGMHIAARRVRVGRLTSARAEILAGVDAGQHVIVGGAAVAKAEILKRRAMSASGGNGGES
jgi:cobalt-zinc-cadmium efflux system membrane fusion protein